MSFKGEIAVPAYAKINLFLDITGKADNGYHSLSTVMQQVSVADTVNVRLCDGKGIFISCDEPSIPCDEKNIAFKAAKMFIEKNGIEAAVYIDIKKNIPVMAGLGGSSTDGAAVLIAMNRLCGNIMSLPALEKAGANLGADVPFCIRGGAAVCKGVGDEMKSISGLDDSLRILIVKPNFSCNTAEAYSLYDKQPVSGTGDFEGFIEELEKKKGYEGEKAYNVFEKLYKDERIGKIKSDMKAKGAISASLTGSGSGVFGIFENEEKAENAAKHFDFPFKFVAKPVQGLK